MERSVMGKMLEDIAQKLKDSNKKAQLIYAFNGTGKTRLSQKFKKLVCSNFPEEEDGFLTRDKFYIIMLLQKTYFTGITT